MYFMLLDNWYFSYAICEKVVMFYLDCVVNRQYSRRSSRIYPREVRILFYVLQFCKCWKLVVPSPVKFWSQPLIIRTLLSLNWVLFNGHSESSGKFWIKYIHLTLWADFSASKKWSGRGNLKNLKDEDFEWRIDPHLLHLHGGWTRWPLKVSSNPN